MPQLMLDDILRVLAEFSIQMQLNIMITVIADSCQTLAITATAICCEWTLSISQTRSVLVEHVT